MSVRKTNGALQSVETLNIDEIKQHVIRDAWIVLKKYFKGEADGNEAKIAVITLGIVVKEMQAKNNERQLTLMEKRFDLVIPAAKITVG